MTTDLNALSVIIGALISFSLEKTGYYQDETKPAAVKIGLVLALCVLWAAIVSFLTIDALPTTFIAWRDFVLMLILTGTSSQVFHQAVNDYLPSLSNFAIAMRKTTTVASSSTTISDGGNVVNTSKETVQTPNGQFEILVTPATDLPVGKSPAANGVVIGGATRGGGLSVVKG